MRSPTWKGVRVGQVTISRGDGKLTPGNGPARRGDAILRTAGISGANKVPAATWGANGTAR